jgi:hypothetical protein
MNVDAYDHIPLRTVPDLRGLVAEDASGLHVGELWGALAEADTGLLRYLDLQLTDQPRHVLVPIGHARIRGSAPDARVRLRAALLEELQAIPAYESDPDAIADPYERALLEAHGRAYHGERYYAHPSYDHSGLYAGEHPLVRTDSQLPPAAPLLPLGELPGYRIADEAPDIRGWEVFGAADGRLGVVHDLIVDTVAEKVRYAVLDDASGERRLVLPIGYIHVDPAAGRVHAPALYADDLHELPGWTGGALERTDEEALQAALRERVRAERRYLAPDFNAPLSSSGVEQRRAQSGS